MAGRKKNPYDTGGKVKHYKDDVWEYDGYLIEANQVQSGGGGRNFMAKIQGGRGWDRLRTKRFMAHDLASAVERARLAIDQYNYRESLNIARQDIFDRLDRIIDDWTELYAPGGQPGYGEPTALANRSAIARALEKLFDGAREVKKDPSTYSEGARHQAERDLEGAAFFNNLSVQDRLKWIDARIENKRLWLGLPKKNPRKKAKKKVARRKKNPYDTGGKAKRGGKDLWLYDGHLIYARKIKLVGGDPGDHYVAEAHKGNRKKTFMARDLASAVERARLAIDLERYVNNLSVDQQAMFGRISNRIDDYIEIYAPGGRPGAGRPTALANRSVTARVLQKYFDEARQVMADPSSSAGDKYAAEYALEGAKFFNNLSVQDRLKWIDARIEDKRLWYGLPKKNPRKKAKKKVSRRKKNPYNLKDRPRLVSKDLWRYRDFEIRTSYLPVTKGSAHALTRGRGVYRAAAKPVGPAPGWWEDPNDWIAMGRTKEGALEKLVLMLAKASFEEQLGRKERAYLHEIDKELTFLLENTIGNRPNLMTRAKISRQLKLREEQETKAGINVDAYAFFNSLPLQDRLDIIQDRVNRFRIWAGLPLTKNPRRKKAKKKASRAKKNNPYSRLESMTRPMTRKMLEDIKKAIKGNYPHGRLPTGWKRIPGKVYEIHWVKDYGPLPIKGRLVDFRLDITAEDDDDPGLQLLLTGGEFNPEANRIDVHLERRGGPKEELSTIHPILTEVLRHEIEHATQDLDESIRARDVLRKEEMSHPVKLRQEFMLNYAEQIEVEALVAGVYLSAKKKKQNFWDLLLHHFDWVKRRYRNVISEKELFNWYGRTSAYALKRYPELKKQQGLPEGQTLSSMKRLERAARPPGGARQKNPYDTRGKMQNIAPDLWKYRGYEIAIVQAPADLVRMSNLTPTGRVFTAKIKLATPTPIGDENINESGKRTFHLSKDIPSLLELARLQVDAHEYRNSLLPAKRKLFSSMDLEIAAAFYILKEKGASISRASVARELQVRSSLPADRQWPVERAVYDFFNKLPVKDRMAWLNARLKRLRLQEDLPLENPRKKAKKAKKKVSRRKKNPYDTKQKMKAIGSNAWRYRDFEIDVSRNPGGQGFRFKMKLVGLPPKKDGIVDSFNGLATSYDEEAAGLELTRLGIDDAYWRDGLLGADVENSKHMSGIIFSSMYSIADEGMKVNRSNLARDIARHHQSLLITTREGSLSRGEGEHLNAINFFDGLPVKDRLSWLDSKLRTYQLLKDQEPKVNPPKKAKKKVSRRKKNPYDTKAKMQNIASDLWKYRGYEVQISRRRGASATSAFTAQITRVGPAPGGDYYDDVDGRAISHKDETTLLELARLKIDDGLYEASLSPAGAYNFKRMNGEISAAFVDVVTYQQKSPTRANVTRQIEKLHQKARRQVTIGAGTPFSDPKDALKAFGFFNGLPVKDRLAWVDAKIKELKLSIPLTNPRIGGKKRKRRRLSPGEVARLLSPEGQREMEERDRAIKGELLHRIIRDIIKDFHENGKQISRAAVSRRLQEIFSGGRHQHIADFITGEKAFNAMPVSERLNLIDTEISAYKTKHGITNPRKKAKKKVSRRKKNPYDTKAKMRNIASDLWKYRGYEIKTQRGPWGKGGKPRFVATIDRVDPHQHPGYDILDNRQISHEDEVALLELARLRIDRDLYMRGLSEGDQRSAVDIESEIEYAFTDVHSTQKKALTRANISRRLEVVRDEAKGILGPKGHARVKAFEFFDSLPLKDRLSWVDARIKDLKIQYGLPLTNPRKKAKKKVSRRKKNPEDWDFTEAKRRLRKARHALENADRGGYRGEGVASRGSALSDYTRAYQEAAMGVFILNRMIFLDIDASRAKRALWAQSAKGVMQGEGEALDVFWNTTEAVFRQCGIRITPEMKGTLSLHFIGSVSKDLQSWKARPTGDTILPSPEDLDSWISAASLTITKWKHGQKPRMKREEQILFLLDVLASTFIIATAAPKLQPRGQREKDKAPRLLIPSIALGIDAQDLLAAECKEGQRERARVKHAKGRSGNPKKAPTAKELVAKCQKLWEAYCKKPGVTKLRAVAKHCEAMKASKAKTVTKERQGCLRSIRAEAKSRGWKL